MMLFVLTNWRGIAVGALVAGLAAYPAGYMAGINSARVAALQDTVKAMTARKDIDNAVSDIGAYDRCIELGGLHLDCDQLRGLGKAPETSKPGKSGGQ